MQQTANNGSQKQQAEQDCNLPVLPSGIVYLLKALNNNEIDYRQLSVELEKFPSIAIKIVAIANSAWSLPETPITTLPDACSRIGLNIVRSVSIALCISQVFDPTRCPPFNAKTFWTSALLNAEAAFLCAKDNPEICRNTARLAGLLHNIGLLWLANQKPAETESAILDAQDHQDFSLSKLLYERLEMDYYTVGGQLAAAMQLPEVITEAISTGAESGLANENPLVNNHNYAKQLTASVLQNIDADEDAVSDYAEDSNYQKLVEILPKVQSMAETIFQS